LPEDFSQLEVMMGEELRYQPPLVNGDDRLEIERVLHLALRSVVEPDVVLERKGVQVGDRVLRLLRQCLGVVV
jgi:hypothetical protein